MHVDSICNKVNKRPEIFAQKNLALLLKQRSLTSIPYRANHVLYGHRVGWIVSHLQQNFTTLKKSRCPHRLKWLYCFRVVWAGNKAKRHKRTLVYKCLDNLGPKYLSDYFTRNYNVHSHNTRRRTDLLKPKLSLAKRTFRHSGPAFFNLLPHSIHNTDSLSYFDVL